MSDTTDREEMLIKIVLAALRKLQADPAVRVDLAQEIGMLSDLLEGWGKP